MKLSDLIKKFDEGALNKSALCRALGAHERNHKTARFQLERAEALDRALREAFSMKIEVERIAPRPAAATAEQEILLQLYDKICDAMQSLELLRDVDPDTGQFEQSHPESGEWQNYLSDPGKQLLSDVDDFFKKLRANPLFWEPE